MNRIEFGQGGCDNTRKYLDSYVSSELMVETNHDVLTHLEGCRQCAAELEARTQLRTRLKAAVNAQAVPPELQVRIREKLRGKESGTAGFGWLGAGWPTWAGATAATLVIGSGLWMNYSTPRMPDVSDRPAQRTYIARISASLANILKVGLSDHIHCAVFRKYPKNAPSVEKMEAELGPQYKGLLPVVRAAVPEGYRVVLAHQCGYAGRKFIHLTLEKDGRLLSLVVAHREDGETLGGLSPAAGLSGLPLYQSAAGPYQVAGFEAGNFIAYVISDLKRTANLQIAGSLAPTIREFLIKTPA